MAPLEALQLSATWLLPAVAVRVAGAPGGLGGFWAGLNVMLVNDAVERCRRSCVAGDRQADLDRGWACPDRVSGG